MVQQESKFLVQARVPGHKQVRNPDNESQHNWKARIADDNEEAHEQKREDGRVERVHTVRGQGKSQVRKSRVSGEDSPPGPRLPIIVHNLAIRAVLDPRRQTRNGEEPEAPEVTGQDQDKSLQRPVLDATELFSLLLGQVGECRVSTKRRLPTQVRGILVLIPSKNRPEVIERLASSCLRRRNVYLVLLVVQPLV